MNHNDAIEYWRSVAKNNPNEKTAKVNPHNDFTNIDADFILRYVSASSNILDIASGTGLTIKKYYKKVGHIDAIEKFPELSRFTVDAPNIKIHNEDILRYMSTKKYDVILMFGIVSYFNEAEIKIIYKKYKKNLMPNGVLLIKNQFGTSEDVLVSGYSDELKQSYHSQYRFIDKEVDMLKCIGFDVVDIVDLYPPKANRWSNTHFYAIVAKLK
jgi:SAM-dependent methyltransferase